MVAEGGGPVVGGGYGAGLEVGGGCSGGQWWLFQWSMVATGLGFSVLACFCFLFLEKRKQKHYQTQFLFFVTEFLK